MKITDLEESITTDGVSFLQVFIFLHNVPVKKKKSNKETQKNNKTTKQKNDIKDFVSILLQNMAELKER